MKTELKTLETVLNLMHNLGAKLLTPKSGIGFTCFNPDSINTKDWSKIEPLLKSIDWSVLKWNDSKSFHPKTGEEIAKDAGFYIGPSKDNAMTLEQILAQASKSLS
jgi:hypothetical protein